ncbi:hypothetical protein E2F43_05255 [Seongchinamella unica]|uniref:Uncharacterized protein n=1 Tax=Seongchinamella unica TaxID=2547392 RepID=A0A4R5LW12_9GAMM|nr:hypothetical protein [Seongchinamella unica]TDG15633.1 hypothetical protein E2F43_05255 [Seongchinamella unica]
MTEKTPGQASAEGHTLTIDHPAGGLRYMAHTFDLDGGGVAWVDSGWTDPLASGHVCHYLEGTVTGNESGWRLVTPEGDSVPIQISPRLASLEGERGIAREDLQRAFDELELHGSQDKTG